VVASNVTVDWNVSKTSPVWRASVRALDQAAVRADSNALWTSADVFGTASF
jgi:hypothetical protein